MTNIEKFFKTIIPLVCIFASCYGHAQADNYSGTCQKFYENSDLNEASIFLQPPAKSFQVRVGGNLPTRFRPVIILTRGNKKFEYKIQSHQWVNVPWDLINGGGRIRWDIRFPDAENPSTWRPLPSEVNNWFSFQVRENDTKQPYEITSREIRDVYIGARVYLSVSSESIRCR